MVNVDLSLFDLYLLEIALQSGINQDLPENITNAMKDWQDKISNFLDTLEVNNNV
jgi:hypothetical protein